MSPSKTKLVLVAALATPALACGPFFPATIIDNREALLAAPFMRFTASLAKIPGASAVFHSVSAPGKVSLSEHSLAVELDDLARAGVAPDTIASHRLRRLALVAFGPQSPGHPLPPSLADTTGLPPEFALYYLVAFHLGQGEPTVAAEKLARLLALPAAERHYKSTWAAYGLGRMAQEHYPAVARYYFQQTRELAQAGFADPLGLAAESLGWEAKTYFDANDLAAAGLLYLDQFSTGDSSAPNSLRFVAARLLAHGTPEQIAAFAAHPRLREIPTAFLASCRENAFDDSLDGGATTRWLAALEQAGVTDATQAARLALAAYRFDQLPACERWLKLAAPEDDLALWLRAKLALRDGRVADAGELLSHLVQHSARADSNLAPLAVRDEADYSPASAPTHLRAELSVVKLANRDYAEALALLIESRYWENAAYVAERVLTVDELKSFVESHRTLAIEPPLPRDEDSYYRAPRDLDLDLRALLARRLVRHGRLAESRPYFPASFIPTLDQFIALLEAGQNRAYPAPIRAASLMEAARLLQRDGMPLRGTELAPDFAIWGGEYDYPLPLERRNKLPVGLRPSIDERWRVSLQETGGQRFHYRYLAADLAWDAIALMPDETDATARALIEAGGWIKLRDARAANRFYVALVKRCGSTALGQDASVRHWFPRANR